MEDKYIEENIVSQSPITGDEEIVESIRPKYFSDVIGRKIEKEKIRILIQSAKMRDDVVDHILFHGPPGLGKTTLANVIANELGTNFFNISAPAIERQADIASILTQLKKGDVLFIDEIHRLRRNYEEFMYPVMEDFFMDIIVGKGMGAKSVRINLSKFIIIGATTRVGLISKPLRDRFGALFHLDYMSKKDLVELIEKMSKKIGIRINSKASLMISESSRGTARIAIRLLKRIRDYAIVQGKEEIDQDLARFALNMLEIDSYGLDKTDRKILKHIMEDFNGGPVGLSTIAAIISEEEDTVVDYYEPYLLKEGFLQITPRGRVVTEKAKSIFL